MSKKNENVQIGKAGELAVMAEFAYRGYNVAIPEIDKGEDIFVVNDVTGVMWRVQVKTSSPKIQKKSSAYQFRVRETAITMPQTPELHFVFVMRISSGWRFFIISRNVLWNYTQDNPSLGTLYTDNGKRRQVNITLHNDGRLTGKKKDLSRHLEDWAMWPEI